MVLTDADGGVLGGLWGLTYYGWLFVELLYVPEKLRRGGVATKLMHAAEQEAVRRGCSWAWLDTFTFQALGFYEKLGYQPFGELPEYPSGHRRVFLRKTLKPADQIPGVST